MKDKTALITGSNGGMGRDIAVHMANSSAGVAIHYFRRNKEAEEAAENVRKKGCRAAAFQADLTREEEAKTLIHSVEKEFGTLDILVNNFGPIRVKPWEDVSPAEWEEAFRSVLLSALFCIRQVLPGMRKRNWGRIINIGFNRVEQLTSFQTITPYAVAKTGLLILTRSVAVSEAASGITANMVSPGLMEGGIQPSAKQVPAGRLGKFEDVSNAVSFLASEKAGYVTGTNILVAGGWKL